MTEYWPASDRFAERAMAVIRARRTSEWFQTSKPLACASCLYFESRKTKNQASSICVGTDAVACGLPLNEVKTTRLCFVLVF